MLMMPGGSADVSDEKKDTVQTFTVRTPNNKTSGSNDKASFKFLSIGKDVWRIEVLSLLILVASNRLMCSMLLV